MKSLLMSACKKYYCISCDICVNVILEDVSDKCKSQDKLVMCRDRFYRINGNNGNHLSSKNWVMVVINCENDTYVTMGDKYASAYSNFLWQEKMVHASYNFLFLNAPTRILFFFICNSQIFKECV